MTRLYGIGRLRLDWTDGFPLLQIAAVFSWVRALAYVSDACLLVADFFS